MRSVRTSTITAITAALALVGAAIPIGGVASGLAGSSPQSATVQAASAAPVSAGTLTLRTTSSVGLVEFDGQQQRFRELNQCQIVQDAGAPELLKLQGFVGNTVGTAGFRKGSIGVYEFDAEGDGASNAAQCFRVDAGSFSSTETLGLQLGDDLGDGPGALIATKATISLIAQSRDGKILATLVDADGNPVGTPRSIYWKKLKNGASIKVAAFTGDFSGIRLTATSGSFSLRGANFDLSSVYDGELDCGDSATRDADGLDPAVTLTRLNNADGSDCELVPYTLRNGDQQVEFLKPLDEQTSAQFILDFVWTVSPANTNWQSAAALLPETTIDYDVEGDAGEIPLRWCPDVTTDGSGNPTGIANVLTNPAAVDQVVDTALPDKQFTCIVTQNATVSDGDPDFVTIEQRVYLLGDAVYRFR